MAKIIRMLKIEPMKAPELIEVEHTLENLQELVGGTIQAVYPWEDPVALLCDDDGKFKEYPPNRALVDEEGELYDVVVGTFFICGLTREDFDSIPDLLAEKYTEMFKHPEMFMQTMDGHVIWFKLGAKYQPRIIV